MTTTIAITFLSALSPHQLSVPQRASNGQTLSFTKSPVFKRIPLSSLSSVSCVVVEEDGPSPPPDRISVGPESTSTQNPESLSPTRGCEACGREELEKGCNGEGTIQGGIATVPGFGWWPIKAYRPCPRFVASGGRYRRRGQSMDEVAFGRGEKGVSAGTDEEAKSSKKKQGSRRFKR